MKDCLNNVRIKGHRLKHPGNDININNMYFNRSVFECFKTSYEGNFVPLFWDYEVSKHCISMSDFALFQLPDTIKQNISV